MVLKALFICLLVLMLAGVSTIAVMERMGSEWFEVIHYE